MIEIQRKGKKAAYNNWEQTLVIPKKRIRTKEDIFVVLHELGHAAYFNKENNPIYTTKLQAEQACIDWGKHYQTRR